MISNYQKVIVIGYGVITRDVLETVYQAGADSGYDVEYIEYEVHPFNLAKKFAVAQGIDHCVIEDKEKLLEHFLEALSERRTLIVSASNNYIFPEKLIENSNATIVNFHNALLPAYPGRNAPSWVIYYGEKQTGITWHYVSNTIDGGDIIIQKKCDIGPDMKAYELTAKLMQLAAEAFRESFEGILADAADRVKQPGAAGRRKIYKSSEIPGDGCFDPEDDPKDIFRLLRALDYGKSQIFPPACCILNGERVQIDRYKVAAERGPDEDRLYLPLDGQYLMLRYSVASAENEVLEGR